MDYYRVREDDFVRRNPGVDPPEYYSNYGDKYLKKFSEETAPKLSEAGQEWLDETREALQVKTEDRLLQDPAGFADLERDSEAFREFEFDIHPDAYVESGLADVIAENPMDALEIGLTPDLSEWKSTDTWKQAGETVWRISGELADQLLDGS